MEQTIGRLHTDPEYPYVYETHLHTRTASACAHNTGAEMADACKKAGYTGIVVTDHFYYGNTAIDKALPWQDWVTEFAKGYESARAEGDRVGLQVFFGWESCFEGTEFLILGLTKEWLLMHPEIRDCSIREQYKLVHQGGGIVVHAHPFRKEDYIPEIRLFPEYVDAVEGVNATHACRLSQHHNNPEFDMAAQAYAKEHQLPMTAGSDIHCTDLLYGGMAFSEKMKDAADLCRHILKWEPYRLLNGNETAKKGK